MAERNQQPDRVQPSEQRGGTALRDEAAREQGSWAATAGEGIVPADLGGSDAPRVILADDPQLGGSVLGARTGSDKPATESGIDLSGSDKADAAADSRPNMPPGIDPDLKDVAAVAIHPSQADPGVDESGDQMAANLAAWLSENQSPRARTRHGALAPRESRPGSSTRDRPVEGGLDGPGNGRGPHPPVDVPARSERENGSRPPAEPGLAAIREPEQPHTETDQTNADTDQTLSDSDQTLSDADQTLSDSDQTSADCDQVAADRDQAASDRDLGAGVESREHEITRDMRERTTKRREQTGRERLDVGSERDAVAQARDLAALARDQAAAARDLGMVQRDAEFQQAGGRADFGIEIVMRAAEHRERAAEYRVQATEYRVLAAEDRRAAAHDREQAAEERQRALTDREMFAAELAIPEPEPIDR